MLEVVDESFDALHFSSPLLLLLLLLVLLEGGRFRLIGTMGISINSPSDPMRYAGVSLLPLISAISNFKLGEESAHRPILSQELEKEDLMLNNFRFTSFTRKGGISRTKLI